LSGVFPAGHLDTSILLKAPDTRSGRPDESAVPYAAISAPLGSA
jgi:hypothetical protein